MHNTTPALIQNYNEYNKNLCIYINTPDNLQYSSDCTFLQKISQEYTTKCTYRKKYQLQPWPGYTVEIEACYIAQNISLETIDI